MLKSKYRKISNALYIFCGLLFLVYLFSIFIINIKGRTWAGFDIYSDAILSKYIAESHSLFPEGWCFGNQVYVIATPVLASFFYVFLQDAYLSLAVASCLMTLFCVLSFIWCVKPFVNNKVIIVGLLVFIGGTNISLSAASDMSGIQVFYTMGSYYSCYVLGIFLTLGAFLRCYHKFFINKILLFFVLIVNFCLGMQSLREMLVLNIPLCIIMILLTLFSKRNISDAIAGNKKCILFVCLTSLSNFLGYVLKGCLSRCGFINQSDILNDISDDFIDNFCNSINMLLDYIGVINPMNSKYSLCEFLGAIFSMLVVFATIVCIIVQYVKKSKITTMGIVVVFFVISLMAVFCSGIFVIKLRNIYFFCWYLLVACSIIYLLDLRVQLRFRKLCNYLKYILLMILICISLINYYFSFVNNFRGIDRDILVYRNIVNQLESEGIKYLYSDWRTEMNNICAISKDRIMYGTLKFSNDPEDLWDSCDYLYLDEWFTNTNFNKAYIVLSSDVLNALDEEYSYEYKKEFFSNTQLVHTFELENNVLYFYKGSEKMFQDMIK